MRGSNCAQTVQLNDVYIRSRLKDLHLTITVHANVKEVSNTDIAYICLASGVINDLDMWRPTLGTPQYNHAELAGCL